MQYVEGPPPPVNPARSVGPTETRFDCPQPPKPAETCREGRVWGFLPRHARDGARFASKVKIGFEKDSIESVEASGMKGMLAPFDSRKMKTSMTSLLYVSEVFSLA